VSEGTVEKTYLRDPDAGPSKLRLLGRCGLGLGWFGVAGAISVTTSRCFAHDLREPVLRTLWLVLLLGGYWLIGRSLDKQEQPLVEMGLVRRATALEEWGVGAAVGWGLFVLAVLPMALAGALHPQFWLEGRAWWLFGLNLVALTSGALMEEVAFRGYPFQRLIDAIGPVWATVLVSGFFGAAHLKNPDASFASTMCTILAGVLLSVAYLRTRALWLPWGLHMAWNFTQGVLFGLPVSGTTAFATVVQTRTEGARWLTGGSYGPEAAVWTFVVLLIGIAVLVRVTREYAWEYGFKPIVPGGYPMDAPPPPEHAAMEQATKPQPLVQIAPPQGRGVNPPGSVK